MIDDLVAGTVIARRQPRLCDGKAHGVGHTLAKRAGGYFHARGLQALRMSRRLAAPLSEAFDFVQRKVVSGEKQEAVQEHRAMSGRKDEPVAIEPLWVARVVLQKSRPQ